MAIDKSGDTERERGIQGKLFDDLESVTHSMQSATQNECHGTPSRDTDKLRTLICPDCKREFLCTVEELELYREWDFDRPVRCPTCRLAHNVRRRGKAKKKS